MRCVADSTVFAAFALLNTVGYDREPKQRYEPVRQRVRQALLPYRSLWRDRLRAAGLLEQLQKGAGAPLLDVASALGDPPMFAHQRGRQEFLAAWQAESLDHLLNVADMLRLFWREHELDHLWDEAMPAYRENEHALSESEREIEHLLAGLQMDIEVTAIPNLLDTEGRGYSVSGNTWSRLFIGGETYRAPLTTLLVHELLHRWADVVAEQCAAEVDAKQAQLLLNARFPVVANNYPDVSIWLAETLVRAGVNVVYGRDGILALPAAISTDLEALGFIGASRAERILGEAGLPGWTEGLRAAAREVLSALMAYAAKNN